MREMTEMTEFGEIKLVEGWWLPADELQFVDVLTAENVKDWKRPVMFGRRAPGYYLLRAALEHLQGRAGVAADVGAHVGFWTVWLVSMFRQVWSFEPNPIALECCRRNIIEEIKSAEWEVWDWALGESEQFVELVTSAGKSGHTFVQPSEGGECEMSTLDLMGFEGLDLLKIDTEGSELDVLLGGEEIIRKFKPVIVVEDNGRSVQNFGIQSGEPKRLLEKWGARELRAPIKGNYFMGWD